MARDNNGNPITDGNGKVNKWTTTPIYENEYGMSAPMNNVNLQLFYENTLTIDPNAIYNWYFNERTVGEFTRLHSFSYLKGTSSLMLDLFFDNLIACGFDYPLDPVIGEQLPILPFNNYGLRNVVAWSGKSIGFLSSMRLHQILNGQITPNQLPLFDTEHTTSYYSKINIYYFRGILNGIDYIGCCAYLKSSDDSNGVLFIQGVAYNEILNTIGTHTEIEKPTNDPNNGFPSLPIGQAGDIVKRTWDEIQLPNEPTKSVSSSGMINVYRVSDLELLQFGRKLFKTSERQDYEGDNALDNLATIIKNLEKGVTDTVKGDLTKFVLDTHIIPVSPTVYDNRDNITIGGYELDIVADRVNNDYVTVDMGSVTIPKCYDDFNDYNGTKYKLMLPFVGFVDLNPNYVTNSTINVRYRFNVLDGSFVCFVMSNVVPNKIDTKSIIGVYNGSCCVHMPITGANYSTVVSGMLQTVGGVATGISTGNALTGIGNVLNGLGNSRPNYTQSNQYNASASYMGVRKPYLLIERPSTNLPTNFYERNGALLMSSYKLRDLIGTGYTKISNADMSSFGNWKESEKNEIKRLLENGVYL